VTVIRRDRDVLNVVIANGGTLSGAAEVGEREIVGILMPAAWTAAALSFQALVDGSVPATLVFGAVADAAGAEISFAAAAAGRYLLPAAGLLRGLGKVKVVSGTTAATVAQGAARTIGLVLET
jgi:hypothetical protein